MYIIISLLLNAIALVITAYLVPGVHVVDFKSALFAAIILGILNTIIKPVLVILTFPINILTLGLFTFVINAVVLRLTVVFVPGLSIDNWLAAILGAVVLSVVSTALSMFVKDLSK